MPLQTWKWDVWGANSCFNSSRLCQARNAVNNIKTCNFDRQIMRPLQPEHGEYSAYQRSCSCCLIGLYILCQGGVIIPVGIYFPFHLFCFHFSLPWSLLLSHGHHSASVAFFLFTAIYCTTVRHDYYIIFVFHHHGYLNFHRNSTIQPGHYFSPFNFLSHHFYIVSSCPALLA